MTNSYTNEEVRDSSGDKVVVSGRIPSRTTPEGSPFSKPLSSPVFRYDHYTTVQFDCLESPVGYFSSGIGHGRIFPDRHLQYVDPSDSCVYVEASTLPPKVSSQSAVHERYAQIMKESAAIKVKAPPQMVMSKSMMELDDLLSKLNPLAEEFTPPSESSKNDGQCGSQVSGQSPDPDSRTKQKCNKKSPKEAPRGSRLHREESVKRTVYVADIDQQVTEEQLARLFLTCGHVLDCRVCGDPNSVLRFAFVEFADEGSAKQALDLAGTVIGYYPLRVLPSKTAIVPVNPTFLPRSIDEREVCARTIYCANIDRKITQADVKLFFESLCGEVSKLRLLGDDSHSTRIAFVEFVGPDSAVAALNCSGAILGSMPIRVSPSKTPVRTRGPRA